MRAGEHRHDGARAAPRHFGAEADSPGGGTNLQSDFGVLMSLEPAVAAPAGLIVLGQGLGATAVLAIGLVVAASAGAAAGAP